MVSLPQFSVFVVIFGLHISSVLSDWCDGLSYWCDSSRYCCGNGLCCPKSYTLTTGPIVGIAVGSVIIGIAFISCIIWLCCICCKPSRNTGHVVTIPPQYVQQPYVVNNQYDVMVQQPYPTQVQYPANPPQHVTYIPPTDYEQQRRPERPRHHHNIPRAQY